MCTWNINGINNITMPQHAPHLRKLQRMCMSTMDTRVSARLDSRCLSLLCRPLRIRRVFLQYSMITLILVFWNLISIKIRRHSCRKLCTLGNGQNLFTNFPILILLALIFEHVSSKLKALLAYSFLIESVQHKSFIYHRFCQHILFKKNYVLYIYPNI